MTINRTKKSLESPSLFLSTPISTKLKPWKDINFDGLLVNSYELFKSKKLKEIDDIHTFLEFDGLILMDSGGFLFMNSERLKVNVKDIYNIQKRAKADIGVTLDFPLNLKLNENQRKRRIDVSLQNIRELYEIYDNCIKIMPVIHGFTKEEIEYFIKNVEEISNFDLVGIGSLVNFTRYTVFGKLERALEIIRIVRKRLPNTYIHAFGISSIFAMCFAFYFGADSVDAATWRRVASNGLIHQIEKTPQFPKKNKQNSSFAKEIDPCMYNCNCPVCSKHTLEELGNNWELRALHNAYTFQFQVLKIRKLIKKGKNAFYNYLKKIAETSPIYSRMLNNFNLKNDSDV